ncbi:MAG TPA: mucoidy inhibitor MuiA family protein [Planctomycetota bacterium]|nr:mucoidy inhibitor MuiA family protein [Planctomycetota bacterium]
MHTLALALLAFQAPDARPLSTTIRDVTVFADRALVHRTVQIPAGGGSFVVSGLPLSADPEQVRVRCSGGDVTNVDVTEARAPAMADARREELRRQLVELGRDEASMEDERRILEASVAAVSEMMTLGSNASKPEVITGKLDVAAWSSDQDALLSRLRQQKKALRDLQERREEAMRRKQELQNALGAADVAGGVVGRQVKLEVIAAAAVMLEVEYVVSNAGWHPTYDLRAAADAKSVELVYRADVYQRSGEDWNDVDVSLSTAQPQVGAQGPEPQAAWVSLINPRAPAGSVELKDYEKEASGDEYYLGRGDAKDAAPRPPAEAPAPRPFASVESQGLSVRFHLPKHETLPSRPEPTRVLVAEESLKVTSEYFCTPALDLNVWLRGKAVNTTAWTILPGRAAVYFGADFLGHADLAAVQPGEELTLHLGRDPGLTLERVQTEDLAKQPGVFGSRTTQVDGWRVKIKNTGALVVGPDGSATVFVREALPRATDDRIKVELADAKPEPSTDARWKKDRDEQGFVTWAVKVPRGGETQITWRVKLSFPEGLLIAR